MVLLLCRQMCLDPIEMQPRAHRPEPHCSELAAIFYILGPGKRAEEDSRDLSVCVCWGWGGGGGTQDIGVWLNAEEAFGEDSWNQVLARRDDFLPTLFGNILGHWHTSYVGYMENKSSYPIKNLTFVGHHDKEWRLHCSILGILSKHISSSFSALGCLPSGGYKTNSSVCYVHFETVILDYSRTPPIHRTGHSWFWPEASTFWGQSHAHWPRFLKKFLFATKCNQELSRATQ